MGLFDIFKGKSSKGAAAQGQEKPKANPSVAKWAERAADKRAQNYDRQEAIQALAEMGTADAAAALLRRFTFNSDPSITDQEEKEAAFAGIVAVGKDAVEPVRAFAAKAESLAWPMRIIKELLSEEEYLDELLLWLQRWDTEYAKFIDPKIQILATLEEVRDPKVAPAVGPFLRDVNEQARFHAVVTLLAQDDPSTLPLFLEALAEEESLRIKNKVAEALAARGWVVDEELRPTARKHLPPGFTIDGEGLLRKHEGASVAFGLLDD